MQKITIQSHLQSFPYIGNGIAFEDALQGLSFDSQLVATTSNFVWRNDCTLPVNTLEPLPHPLSAISDIASCITMSSTNSLISSRY